MRTKSSKTELSQKERVEMACARAGTLRDKIETARRSANEVRQLARGLKSELKETIKLLNAIRRQMEETLTHTDVNTNLRRPKDASVCACQRRTMVTNP